MYVHVGLHAQLRYLGCKYAWLVR
eukprot:COSAG01_NODE_73799_length_236_cov_1.744526_1_plen_23_part_01